MVAVEGFKSASLCGCAVGCCGRLSRWSRCTLTVLLLLAVLCWLVPALITHAIGMLGLYWVMPRVMRHVYPTRLGMVHVLAFRLMHRLIYNERPHSRLIRTDLVADGTAWPFEEDPPDAEWLGHADPAAAGPASPPPSPTETDEALSCTSSIASAADRRWRSPPAAYAVHSIACLLDNYCYAIVDLSGEGPVRPVALVDPADPAAVLRALSELSRDHYSGSPLQPVAILTTHKHCGRPTHTHTTLPHARRMPRTHMPGSIPCPDTFPYAIDQGTTPRVT